MFSHKELAKYAATTEVKRVLATVERSIGKKSGSVLAVTSAAPGEGKSLTAISLAISALKSHRSYAKVLVMDLNWHNPSIHQPFGAGLEGERSQVDGLIDLTLRTSDDRLNILIPDKGVIRASTGYDNAFSFALEMIAAAREEYSLTIVDTRSIFPPSKEMRIDPVKVCSAADFSLVVALAAVTSRHEVQRALKLLKTDGIDNLGVVLNQWRNPIFSNDAKSQEREVAA
ncbi:MAG: hypothetical protein C0609_06465 [Deltaproteobacteria bacterium]|nr:MAG: hypothetical protein C0609_06465 [Deltaproteobacteria bacterium]